MKLPKIGLSTIIGIGGALMSVVAGVLGAMETQKESQKIAEGLIKEQESKK